MIKYPSPSWKYFPYLTRPLQRDIDTAMTMNINSVDGDSIKFNWATNKIYIKLVGSTESLDRQRIPPVDLTQRMLIIHNKI